MQPWNSATVVRIGRSRTAHPRELGDVRNRVRLAAGTASASQSAGSNRGDRAITFAAESRSGHCGRRNPGRFSRTRPVRLLHRVGPCRRRRRPRSLPLECRPPVGRTSSPAVKAFRGAGAVADDGRRSVVPPDRLPPTISASARGNGFVATGGGTSRSGTATGMNPLTLYQIPHFVCDWVDVAAVADDLRRRILLGFGPLGPTCDSRDGTHRRRRPGWAN